MPRNVTMHRVRAIPVGVRTREEFERKAAELRRLGIHVPQAYQLSASEIQAVASGKTTRRGGQFARGQ